MHLGGYDNSTAKPLAPVHWKSRRTYKRTHLLGWGSDHATASNAQDLWISLGRCLGQLRSWGSQAADVWACLSALRAFGTSSALTELQNGEVTIAVVSSSSRSLSLSRWDFCSAV